MTTNASSSLMEGIHRGEFVLMDGALGTELERRGVPIEGAGWSALAVRDYADEFQQAATRWLGAGVQIVGGLLWHRSCTY